MAILLVAHGQLRVVVGRLGWSRGQGERRRCEDDKGEGGLGLAKQKGREHLGLNKQNY